MVDCDCVFDRPDVGELADDILLAALTHCGQCPAVASGPGAVLLSRLRASARNLRRSDSRARQLARELAELQRDSNLAEQRLANLERIQKVSTRELVHKNSLFAMIASITVAASEATSDAAVYRVCMHKICAATGWSLARVTQIADGQSAWHIADPLAADFTGTLPAGYLGPLGQLAQTTSKPQWQADIDSLPAAPWVAKARALGLCSAAALPVLVDGEVTAVVEFFGTAHDSSATALLLAMTTIGGQLGRILSRRRAEAALAHARDVAEAASRAKSTFVANMSHELRTPLNAILGYAELVHEELQGQPLQHLGEDLRRIRQAGEHLLGLINNILDLSKVEANNMPVVPECFDLPALIHECVALLQPLTERRDNTVVVTLAPGLGEITTDPLFIRQLLFNLISNAAKFTVDGTITITADVSEPSGGAAPWLVLCVHDTGIGMTEDQCARLFRPFHQLDPQSDRRSGTGLGLALCRGLCTLLDGTIEVSSSPGIGSTFTVRLPLVAGSPSRG